MSQKIKKVWKMIDAILIAVVIFLAIALVGVRLVGIDIYAVLSGSMEPTYKTGSVIYVKDIDTDKLGEGDVITYQVGGGTIVTHRIVEVVEENGETAFRTKGDANDIVDGSAVSESNVLGTPIFTIPYLGYLVMYIQTTSGKYALFTVAAILVLLLILPDLIFSKEKKESE